MLILAGIILIIASIAGLIGAFNAMQNLPREEVAYSFAYVIGSLIFPLLLTVFGRWLYRKGKEQFRTQN